jgi:hypothetical protein
MAGDSSFKPGQIVKVSGIYSVVNEDGKGTFEVTCLEGEHFPPTRSGKGATLNSNTGRRTPTSTPNRKELRRETNASHLCHGASRR